MQKVDGDRVLKWFIPLILVHAPFKLVHAYYNIHASL